MVDNRVFVLNLDSLTLLNLKNYSKLIFLYRNCWPNIVKIFRSFSHETNFNIPVHNIAGPVQVIELIEIKIIVLLELWQLLSLRYPIPKKQY